MSENFYRAFEDRHRGSRDLIKSRLRVYAPFIQPLKELDGEAKAIDLGCGRGEWLELITGLGFQPVGVDLDQGMLDACHELGLQVEQGEALSFIAALPDDSQSLVSAFHLVEHVTFEQLRALVSQALRVLKPGGLLIMETPNPENILVATKDFYLDPTHQRPIPPALLAFLPEYYGFARTKILRLQESRELADATHLTLENVLGGASPDYAVVAQKAATEHVMTQFDVPFSTEYGVSLETLATRYQQQADARFAQAGNAARKAEIQANQVNDWIAQQADILAQQAEISAQRADLLAQQARFEARQRLFEQEQLTIAAEARAQAAEDRAANLEKRVLAAESSQLQWQQEANHWHTRVIAIHNSTSWQLTRPLRGIKRLATGDLSIFRRSPAPELARNTRPPSPAINTIRGIARSLLTVSVRFAARRPALKNVGLRLLRPFPAIETRLRGIITQSTNPMGQTKSVSVELHHLSPSARWIYMDLKAAIGQREENG